MKKILTFSLFESSLDSPLSEDQIEFLNKHTSGKWTYDASSGLVNVDGNFNFGSSRAKSLLGIKFGRVSGYFTCSNNNLTSLEGAPQEVSGDFDCFHNNLTSLVGAPQEVGEDFSCFDNNLTSLEGAPQEVGGNFSCFNNNLTSLVGAPQKVDGDFFCVSNNLTSLEGAPQEVGGYFYCDGFHLKSGEWNPRGWLRILKEETPKAKELIRTIFNADVLNKKMEEVPEKTIGMLKGVLNDPDFKEIRKELQIPDNLKGTANLLGDLGELGI